MRFGVEVRAEVLRVCALPEYADLPSGQIVADLADRGVRYLCSVSSMYRILREAGLVRCRDRTRAPRPRPRGLCARGPRGVWVWDITWLPSACGGHCWLYMALDIHGRKIVGWAVHKCESAELAAEMVARACAVEGVLPGRLTLYSDNGSAMRESAMVAMLDALVVASSLSRPASSNDNPHNEVWVWDITLLPTTARGCFFPMFAVMDLFSRKVVAMAVHDTQDAEHAAALFTGAFKEHKIAPGTLTVHADIGPAMRAQPTHACLQSIGADISHLRAGVSNDNAQAESLFRTLKHHGHLPVRAFDSSQAAIAWAEVNVFWYNNWYRHSALHHVTPSQCHRGKDVEILCQRCGVIEQARAAHPERWFIGRTHDAPEPAREVWINPPPGTEPHVIGEATPPCRHAPGSRSGTRLTGTPEAPRASRERDTRRRARPPTAPRAGSANPAPAKAPARLAKEPAAHAA